MVSILKVSVLQVKAARALLDWSQTKLAEASGVSLPTVKRLEAERHGDFGGKNQTYEAIIGGLERAGIEFENSESAIGVRLKRIKGDEDGV